MMLFGMPVHAYSDNITDQLTGNELEIENTINDNNIDIYNWKSLTVEEINKAILDMSFEETGYFLMSLEDEEFEEIMSLDSILNNTVEIFGTSDGEDFYSKYSVNDYASYSLYKALNDVNAILWSDNGRYENTAVGGYFYLELSKDEYSYTSAGKETITTKTESVTVKVEKEIISNDRDDNVNFSENEVVVTRKNKDKTNLDFKINKIHSESQNYVWSGLRLYCTYSRPKHYLPTFTSNGIAKHGRFDTYVEDFSYDTLDHTHKSTETVNEAFEIQVNGYRIGLVEGYANNHDTGYLKLKKYYNELVIDPNGGKVEFGDYNSESIVPLISKVCDNTTIISNLGEIKITRKGYKFTGWEIIALDDGASKNYNEEKEFTHENTAVTWNASKEKYANQTVRSALQAQWEAVPCELIVRHHVYDEDGGVTITKDDPRYYDYGTYLNTKETDKFKKTDYGENYLMPASQNKYIDEGTNYIDFYYYYADLTMTPNNESGNAWTDGIGLKKDDNGKITTWNKGSMTINWQKYNNTSYIGQRFYPYVGNASEDKNKITDYLISASATSDLKLENAESSYQDEIIFEDNAAPDDIKEDSIEKTTVNGQTTYSWDTPVDNGTRYYSYVRVDYLNAATNKTYKVGAGEEKIVEIDSTNEGYYKISAYGGEGGSGSNNSNSVTGTTIVGSAYGAYYLRSGNAMKLTGGGNATGYVGGTTGGGAGGQGKTSAYNGYGGGGRSRAIFSTDGTWTSSTETWLIIAGGSGGVGSDGNTVGGDGRVTGGAGGHGGYVSTNYSYSNGGTSSCDGGKATGGFRATNANHGNAGTSSISGSYSGETTGVKSYSGSGGGGGAGYYNGGGGASGPIFASSLIHGNNGTKSDANPMKGSAGSGGDGKYSASGYRAIGGGGGGGATSYAASDNFSTNMQNKLTNKQAFDDVMINKDNKYNPDKNTSYFGQRSTIENGKYTSVHDTKVVLERKYTWNDAKVNKESASKSAEIVTGTYGAIYLKDTNPNTTLKLGETKAECTTGLRLTKNNYINDDYATNNTTSTYYLHIAPIDNGGNVGNTIHIKLHGTNDSDYGSEIKYSITYKGLEKAETTNLKNPTSYTIKDSNFTLNNPTGKIGSEYIFIGWTEKNNYNIDDPANTKTGPDEEVIVDTSLKKDLVFTANWIKTSDLSMDEVQIYDASNKNNDYSISPHVYKSIVAMTSNLYYVKTGEVFRAVLCGWKLPTTYPYASYNQLTVKGVSNTALGGSAKFSLIYEPTENGEYEYSNIKIYGHYYANDLTKDIIPFLSTYNYRNDDTLWAIRSNVLSKITKDNEVFYLYPNVGITIGTEDYGTNYEDSSKRAIVASDGKAPIVTLGKNNNQTYDSIWISMKDDISGKVASGLNPEATKIYVVNQKLGHKGYDSSTGEIDGADITNLIGTSLTYVDRDESDFKNESCCNTYFKLNYNDPEIENLIKGAFKIVVVAEDNVGNKSVTVSDEFTPTIKINAKIVNTSIGSSESEMQSYKAGEDGKLIIRTTGYVNKLTIIFPKEIRDYNEELNNQIIITNPTPTYSQENTYEFSISLDTKQFKDYKDISIKAENEYGSTPANAKVYLNVIDKATDDIIDRIRNNN